MSIFCSVGISGFVGAIFVGFGIFAAQVFALFITDTVSCLTCTGTHSHTHAHAHTHIFDKQISTVYIIFIDNNIINLLVWTKDYSSVWLPIDDCLSGGWVHSHHGV